MDDSGHCYLAAPFAQPSLRFGLDTVFNAGAMDAYVARYNFTAVLRGQFAVRAGWNMVSVPVIVENYWGRYLDVAEPFVYDASYVKLREIKLSYRLPSKWLKRTPVKLATISLVGRNLWVIHKNVPNVDPESFYTSQNPQGIEWLGVPQTRSLGFNFNLRL